MQRLESHRSVAGRTVAILENGAGEICQRLNAGVLTDGSQGSYDLPHPPSKLFLRGCLASPVIGIPVPAQLRGQYIKTVRRGHCLPKQGRFLVPIE